MPTGSTGELYADADNPGSVLGAPSPAPPTDLPPPTKVAVVAPVTTKGRMADERPDGTIKDTSMDALRPSNDLGFRNLSDESLKKPETPAEPPKEAAPASPVVPEAVPVPEKLYAGKFKTPEDLVKGYEEAQKLITRQGQEKAELEKKLLTPALPQVDTPEQTAAKQKENDNFLASLVNNGEKVVQDIIEKKIVQRDIALQSQHVAEQWRKNNPDIAEHEIRVAFEATLLAQSDPELAANHVALIQKATDNFRQFAGKIRTEGAREALVTETRSIPLLSNTAPTAATEQPAKAPLTADAAYEQHLQMLKAQEQRSHRGLRR